MCIGQAASALSVSYNANDSGTAPTTGNFSVPQFDPALGILLSVELEVEGNSSGGTNEVENENESAGGSATLTIGTDIQVTGPAALLHANST